MNKLFFITTCLFAVSVGVQAIEQQKIEKPNIVIIYADDLGFGDIGVNGAIGVQTPHIDCLAKSGVNFSDAHCTAATCTPSRFSLLTGTYGFRTKAAVLQGDAPLLIDPAKETLPSMLKKAGYVTGVVGKWHLGLGNGNANWNEEVKPGPREVGFDYSFLIPATGDRVPCVFLENQKVVGADKTDPIQVSYSSRIDGYPVGTEHPELLKMQTDAQHLNSIINGISRIGFMSGGKKARWKDEEFPFILTKKAKAFIKQNKNQPFFLFFAFHDIHQPRIAHKKFVGKSSMGPRGDVIAQMDWCVGQLVKQLEVLGLKENTLIVFSSDNGPVLNDGYLDQAVEMVGSHKPAGPFRGTKYSILEGGTRMPTIVNWPAKVKSGKSSALLSQVDLYASLAKLVGQNITPSHAPDSEEHLDAWLGTNSRGREFLLTEASTTALRMYHWKYIKPLKGGTPVWVKNKIFDGGMSEIPQLFDLKADIQETKNVAEIYPEIVRKMSEKLQQIENKPTK